TAALVAGLWWSARNLAAGRAGDATGSNPAAARLSGLDPALVRWAGFTLAGVLAGAAAGSHAARVPAGPPHSGLRPGMEGVAAAVVGGASVRGGRGTVKGTVLGVVLLGAVGPALTFLGVDAYWERAIQGAIILAAVVGR